MWKISIICFFFSVAFGQMCPGTDLTDSIRQAAVNSHNTFRSQLAQGQSTLRGGARASSARNMYKLNYDCAIEATAQAWANGCQFQHSTSGQRNGAGENLYMTTAVNANQLSSINQAASLWWKELADFGGITQSDTTLTSAAFNTGIGHWSQMAWGKTTSIGCGIKSCPAQRMTIVVCQYKVAGNYLNQPVYEIGSPCRVDSDCTTYANSRCDAGTGLCFTGTGSVVTPTLVPTLVPTAPPSGICADMATNCAMNSGLCNNAVYFELMGQKCALTCGRCTNSLPTTCTDSNAASCAMWVGNGFCFSNYYTAAQKRQYCARSCNLC